MSCYTGDYSGTLAPSSEIAELAWYSYCQVHPGTDGAVVVGYDATTGATLWATNGYGGPPSVMALSPDGTELFISGAVAHEGYVTSMVSTSDGAAKWTQLSIISPHAVRFETPTSIAVAQAPGGDPNQPTVYVTGPQGTIALNYLDGGQPVWKRFNAGSVGTSLAVSQDQSELLVAGCQPPVTTCQGSKLTAYNTVTGTKMWALPDSATQVIASPSGPQVFVLTSQSGRTEIAGFDIATGTRTELWHAVTVTGQIAVNRTATTVFTGIGTATVDAYNAATGALVSSTSDAYPGRISSAAVSMNGSKLFDTGGIPSTTGSPIGYLTETYHL